MSAEPTASEAVESPAKELASHIQQFLAHQVETNGQLTEAAKESLSVATECIEQAYGLTRKPASDELAKIYQSSKQTPSNQANGPSLSSHIQQILSQVAGAGFQQQATSAPTTSASSQPNAPPKVRKIASEAEKIAAESFKNQGNDLMKQEKFKEALDYYTQAIEIDGNNAIYYSNRAAASSKLGDHQAALRDCQEAIEIDPTYSKAYSRMGLVYASLEDHRSARDAYAKAVELDPLNESYRNNLNIAAERLAETAASAGTAGAGLGAAAGVDTGPNGAGRALNPSDFLTAIQSMFNNQDVMAAVRGMQDPRAQSVLDIGADALRSATRLAAMMAANPAGAPSASATANSQNTSTEAPTAPASGAQEPTVTPESGGGTTATGQQSQQQQPTSQPTNAQGTAGTNNQQPPGNNSAPPLNIFNIAPEIFNARNADLVGAGQQLLSSIQQNNPDLANLVRRVASQALSPPQNSNNNNNNDRNPPPGYS